jgi:hypothetical protein
MKGPRHDHGRRNDVLEDKRKERIGNEKKVKQRKDLPSTHAPNIQ